MEKFKFLFGTALPSCVQKVSAIFPAAPKNAQQSFFKKDCFFSDGSPKEYNRDIIYPCYASHYLGHTLPSAYLDIQPEYSKTASQAAYKWLQKVLDNFDEFSEIHGEELTVNISGEDMTFCFPLMDISYESYDSAGSPHTEKAIVIPIADSRDNDEEWSDNIIPSYANLSAQLSLWCYYKSWEMQRRDDFPQKAFVVRICGNTSSEIKIRTVNFDLPTLTKTVQRLVFRFVKAQMQGKDPRENVVRKESLDWRDKKTIDNEDAYVLQDPALYQLLEKYQDVYYQRKVAEESLSAIKNEMDSIAISLAAQTDADAPNGKVSGTNRAYCVTHIAYSPKKPSISAELLRQFYPQYADQLISTTVYEKRRLEVEAF